MQKIELHIQSPEKELLSTLVERVELPGAMGRFVILQDHAPIISALVKGEIRYRTGGEEHALPIVGGFVKVKDNSVQACVEL